MSRARVVVFPIKGRTWCFTRSIDASVSNSSSSSSPSLRDLWKKLSSNDKPVTANAELVVDFVSDKMNKAWTGFEKAPEGSFKNKIHGFKATFSGQALRNFPKIYFKGRDKDGDYISCKFECKTRTPKIKTHCCKGLCHSQKIHGSEKLLLLVSDGSEPPRSNTSMKHQNSRPENNGTVGLPWVLQPSKALEELVNRGNADDGLSKCVISDICKTFGLNTHDVLKYKKST